MSLVIIENSFPTDVKVHPIKISPGTGVVNNKNMLGAVVFSSITITSPDGESAALTWGSWIIQT